MINLQNIHNSAFPLNTGWKIGSWMGNSYSEIFGINFIDSSNAFDIGKRSC